MGCDSGYEILFAGVEVGGGYRQDVGSRHCLDCHRRRLKPRDVYTDAKLAKIVDKWRRM